MYIDRPKKKKKKGNEIHIHRFGTSLRSIARLAKRRPSFTELTSRNTEEKGEEKKKKRKEKKGAITVPRGEMARLSATGQWYLVARKFYFRVYDNCTLRWSTDSR